MRIMKFAYAALTFAIQVPLAILFGLHIEAAAGLARRYLGIPCIVSTFLVLAGELAVFGVFSTLPVLGILVLSATAVIFAMFNSWRELIDEPVHPEYLFMAHLLILSVIFFCDVFPELNEAILRRREQSR